MFIFIFFIVIDRFIVSDTYESRTIDGLIGVTSGVTAFASPHCHPCILDRCDADVSATAGVRRDDAGLKGRCSTQFWADISKQHCIHTVGFYALNFSAIFDRQTALNNLL